MPREGYRVGMPRPGRWVEALNTDSAHYGGSDVGNLGAVEAEGVPWHDQPYSAELTLPPLGVASPSERRMSSSDRRGRRTP